MDEPDGGVYALVDSETGQVRFVGRSRDVDRRVAYWTRVLEEAGDVRRPVVVRRHDDPIARIVMEQKALDQYGTVKQG